MGVRGEGYIEGEGRWRWGREEMQYIERGEEGERVREGRGYREGNERLTLQIRYLCVPPKIY